MFGDFIEGCAVKALAVEKARSSLKESFLLKSVLGFTVKAFCGNNPVSTKHMIGWPVLSVSCKQTVLYNISQGGAR